MSKKWQLQEAKNKLSELIQLTHTEGAQWITRHGKDEAVVLSYEDYKKMVAAKGSIKDFFQSSPLYGLELDLDRTISSGRNILLED